MDERHIIARKFLEACGFQLEAVLRKHKVVQRRNRNTALYVVLNSDWTDLAEAQLRRKLGYGKEHSAHKIAEIEQLTLQAAATAANTSGSNSGNKGGDKKKSKKGGRG